MRTTRKVAAFGPAGQCELYSVCDIAKGIVGIELRWRDDISARDTPLNAEESRALAAAINGTVDSLVQACAMVRPR